MSSCDSVLLSAFHLSLLSSALTKIMKLLLTVVDMLLKYRSGRGSSDFASLIIVPTISTPQSHSLLEVWWCIVLSTRPHTSFDSRGTKEEVTWSRDVSSNLYADAKCLKGCSRSPEYSWVSSCNSSDEPSLSAILCFYVYTHVAVLCLQPRIGTAQSWKLEYVCCFVLGDLRDM